VDAELALQIAAEHAAAHCARLDAALDALVQPHAGSGGVSAERFDEVRLGGWAETGGQGRMGGGGRADVESYRQQLHSKGRRVRGEPRTRPNRMARGR
jgi:hypothetical protein